MSERLQKQEEFKCPSCGSRMNHDADTENLSCPSCGYIENSCRENADNVMFDFESVKNDPVLKDWGVPVKTVDCSDCGGKAVVITANDEPICPFCGSKGITVSNEPPGIRPDSIIPFKIDNSKARERMSEWINKQYLAPFSFKSEYNSSQLAGVYLPYWSFDAQVNASYTGQVANSYMDTEIDTVTSDERTDTKKHKVRKLRWRFVSGTIEKKFKNVIFNDIGLLDSKTVERLEPFKLNELVKYTPNYLAGYAAGRCENGLQAVWGRAQSYMGSAVREEVHSIVKRGTDVVGAVNTCAEYTEISFKQLLLPVWIGSYRFKNKNYHIYINGQTGLMFGRSPKSVLKFGIIGLVAAAIIAALILFL